MKINLKKKNIKDIQNKFCILFFFTGIKQTNWQFIRDRECRL